MRLGPLEITLHSKAAPRAGALSPIAEGRGGWFPLIREWTTGAWQRNEDSRSTDRSSPTRRSMPA